LEIIMSTQSQDPNVNNNGGKHLEAARFSSMALWAYDRREIGKRS